MMHLKPTGSAIAILVLIAGVLLGATPASATHPGPCNFHRLESESIKHLAKRKIVCAVERWGPVPGGPARAICIAKRESGLDPSATSEPTGRYRGLFQHDRSFWAWRYDTYTMPAWELSHRALNGRTNAIITIRMVVHEETWRGAGWLPKEC
jgi:hypothetical protein